MKTKKLEETQKRETQFRVDERKKERIQFIINHDQDAIILNYILGEYTNSNIQKPIELKIDIPTTVSIAPLIEKYPVENIHEFVKLLIVDFGKYHGNAVLEEFINLQDEKVLLKLKLETAPNTDLPDEILNQIKKALKDHP